MLVKNVFKSKMFASKIYIFVIILLEYTTQLDGSVAPHLGNVAPKNTVQFSNVGAKAIAFNHVYSISVPSEQCNCFHTTTQESGSGGVGIPKENKFETKVFQQNKESGYVTPSFSDVDENDQPYSKKFRFIHNITVPVQKCLCKKYDNPKLKQQNKNLKTLLKKLETKLSKRIGVLEQKIMEQQSLVSSCTKKCKKTIKPKFDVIDKINNGDLVVRSTQLVSKCPSDCSGNGECIDGLCKCRKGYEGIHCSRSLCVNGCSDHGVCTRQGICKCWGQWTGEDCSTKGCPKQCSGNGICENGICSCSDGYIGNDCAKRQCPNNCSGHGKCNLLIGKCFCNAGWKGDDCATKKCPRDCSGNGECVKGKCICEEPWIGKACKIKKCLNDCSLHGKCKNGTCLCGTGWHGADCGKMICDSNCSGYGECNNGTCVCFAGRTGVDCSQTECPDECSNHGRCSEGTCVCDGDWDGLNCGQIPEPSGLTITNVQPSTIDVSWTKTSNAITGNQVNCIPMSGTANAVYQAVGPNVTKLTIRDLDSGTQYSVYVYAMVEDTLSSPVTASVHTGVDSPTKLNYLRIGDTFAEITWTAPKAKIDRYKLVCSCKQGGAEFNVLPNKTSVLIKDFSPGASYSVTLYAVQGDIISSPTHINFTTSLDTPKQVEIVNVTSEYATVRWTPVLAEISGYQILLIETNLTGSQPITKNVSVSTNEVTFHGLKADTKYNVTIFSVRDDTMKSLPLYTTLIAGIEPAVNFTITKVKPYEVAFHWKSPNDKIKQFQITMHPQKDYTQGKAPLIDSVLPKGINRASFSKLQPGSSYVVEVFSVDGERKSGPLSNTITTALDTPTGLKLELVTSHGISISWNGLKAKVNDYVVKCVHVNTGRQQEFKISTDELYAEFSGLIPAAQYNISVQGEKEGTDSLAAYIQTYTSLPAPENVQVTSPTYTDISVVWDSLSEFNDKKLMGLYHVIITPHLFNQDGSAKSEEFKLDENDMDYLIPGFNNALTLPGILPGLLYKINITAKSNAKLVPESSVVEIDYLSPIDPPHDVVVSFVGYNNATLHWFPSIAPVTGYRVSYQDIYRINPWSFVDISYNQTFITISNLTDETMYIANITALMHSRTSIASTMVFNTDMMLIEPPEHIMTKEIRSDAVEIEWLPSISEKIDGYFISFAPVESPGLIKNITVPEDSTTAIIHGLFPCTNYFIGISTMHRDRTSILVELQITTAIDSPTALMFVVVSDTSFTFHWKAPVSDITQYIVNYYRSDVGSDRQDVIIPPTETICSVHGLLPATEYTVEIYATGNSSQSIPSVAIVETLPATVRQLRSPKQGINQITLKWLAPDVGGDITGYKLNYFIVDDSLNIKTIELAKHQTQFTVKDLFPATKYHFNVYSKRNSDLSNVKQLTQATMIPPVRLLTTLTMDDSTVTVRWKPPLDVVVDGYIVSYRSLDVLGDYIKERVGSDTLSLSLRNLAAETQYSVRVYSTKSDMKSKTKQIKATTASALESPSYINVTDVRDTVADISWEIVSDKTVMGYLLTYKPIGGNNDDAREENVMGRRQNSIMLMKLKPGTLYYVSVAAQRLGRVSFPPNTHRFVTALLLTPPSIILVDKIEENSVSLRWASQESDQVKEYHVTYSCTEDSISETSEIVPMGNRITLHNIDGLMPGRHYKVEVRSFRWGEDSSQASTVYVKTLYELIPPTDVLVTVNQTGVNITWLCSTPDANGYNCSILDALTNNLITDKIMISKETNEASFNGLVPGQTYRIELSTTREQDRSQSRIVDFKTDDLLVPPSNITTQFIGEIGVNVSWILQQQNYDNLTVKYYSDDNEDVGSMVVNFGITTYSILELKPSTLYHAEVIAWNGNKTSLPKKFSFETDYIVPPPNNLQFRDINETSLVVAWERTSRRAQYFKIRIVCELEKMRTITVTGSTTSIPLEQLHIGTTYNVSVTAFGNDKESERLTGQVTTLLRGPKELNSTEITSESVNLRWCPLPVGVDRYVIVYYQVEKQDSQGRKFKRFVVDDEKATSTNITGLKPATSYMFRLMAEKNGQESFSAEEFVRTEIDNPKNVKTSMVGRRSANLTWSLVSADGITGYQVSLFSNDGQLRRYYNLSAQSTHIWLRHLSPTTQYNASVMAVWGKEISSGSKAFFKTGEIPYPKPMDCVQILLNGEWESKIYTIYIADGTPLQVFCDLRSDGGGWITVLRRIDGSVSFHRTWDEYASGFGNKSNEFWIGLETLHELTMKQNKDQELRIQMKHDGESVYATYDRFSVSDEKTGFILNGSTYGGNAGDSLSYHFGMKFTTFDKDNDQATNRNCAKEYKGAWWFKNCHRSSLNGQYGNTRHSMGINWFTWGGFTRSIEFVEMKIRPQSFREMRGRQNTRRRFLHSKRPKRNSFGKSRT